MKSSFRRTSHLFTILLIILVSLGNLQAQTPQLDAFWAEISRTVAAGDFEGYGATFHEDAVLVSNFSNSSTPIVNALADWKQGFLDTQEGKMTAEVTFRFSQRLSDGNTAHETGIFRYVATQRGQEPSAQLIHFEALLVNKGGWKMIMEYQKSPATVAEWESLSE